MGWLENIGKNDDGDDVFELTEKALKEIKDNFSKCFTCSRDKFEILFQNCIFQVD
jgi:hypothetical protein